MGNVKTTEGENNQGYHAVSPNRCSCGALIADDGYCQNGHDHNALGDHYRDLHQKAVKAQEIKTQKEKDHFCQTCGSCREKNLDKCPLLPEVRA